MVRVVTGHAFVGSYSARFHPGKRTSCPACGVNPQTVEHTIKVCSRYKGARTAHLSPIAHLSLRAVFGTKKGGRHSISSWRLPKSASSRRGSPRPRMIFPGFSFSSHPTCIVTPSFLSLYMYSTFYLPPPTLQFSCIYTTRQALVCSGI